MSQHSKQDEDISFYNLFIPLTTKKIIIFLIIIGYSVFFNALFNGFVWDDKAYIVHNEEIHNFNLLKIFGPSLFNDTIIGYYRPIPALYFTLTYLFFNQNTFFYHFIQVTIHIINTIIVFKLFRDFFNKNLSFFLAVIFLIHPLQVESVVFIAQSVSPIFFIFGITALLLSREKMLNSKRLVIIYILILLSLLTKETGLIFILLIFLYRLLVAKKQYFTFLIGGGITLLVYLFIRFEIGNIFFSKAHSAYISNLSLMDRIFNMPAVFFYYLKNFIFPIDLAINQKWVITNLNLSSFYLPLFFIWLFLTAICILGIYLAKSDRSRFRVFLFFFLWFAIVMLFHLQIFPLDMTVADRWFYLPVVGLLGISGLAIEKLSQYEKYKKMIITIAIVIICLFSLRTMIRNANWYDEIALFSNDLKIYNSYDLQNALSVNYFEIGNYKDAIYHAQQAIDLHPTEIFYGNLGTLYLYDGKFDYARKAFHNAYNSTPNGVINKRHYRNTYLRLAWVELYAGEYIESIKIIKEGLKEYPTDDGLWYELALCEYQLKNKKEALLAVDKSINLNKNNQNYTYLKEQIKNNRPIQIGSSNVWIDISGL